MNITLSLSLVMGSLIVLGPRMQGNGLYILGSIAIAIHFQIVTNSVLFQYQIFIQQGIQAALHVVSPSKSLQKIFKQLPFAVVLVLNPH
jgi:hypothetical protein